MAFDRQSIVDAHLQSNKRSIDTNRGSDPTLGLSQLGTGQVYLEWRDINYYVPAKREEVAEF